VPASFLRQWLPVLAWAGVIFAFSSIPSLGTELGTWDLLLRKVAHLAEYAVLGALLLRTVGIPVVALTISMLYAVSDEVHQTFVTGRHGSPVDIVIDTAGLVIGLAAWHALSSRRTLA